MNEPNAIFLSASVPVKGRGHFYKNSDPLLIHAAVRALISVVLGRRHLIWGGHPAITPMVRIAAENLGVNFGQWVHLYQSRFFQDQYPQDNQSFQDIILVEAETNDRDKSLEKMRRRMISDWSYAAAVFIGGMEGVFEELKIFQEFHPTATIVPVASAGGAASDIYDNLPNKPLFEKNTLDYVGMFYQALNIDPQEPRSK